MYFVRLSLLFAWMALCAMTVVLLSPCALLGLDLNLLFCRLWSPLALRVARIRLCVEGREILSASRPAVIIGNHQSAVDLMLYAQLNPGRVVAVGKRQLLAIPFFNLWFWAAGNILINRKRKEQAQARVNNAAEIIRTRGVSVFMAPEGTRTLGATDLQAFKKGAFHLAIAAGVPVVPIVCSAVSQVADIPHRRMPGGSLRIRILTPEPTAGLGPEDVEALMQRVRERMRAAWRELNAPIAEATEGELPKAQMRR